ncbi:hypothetical protein SARC_06944 [Sphaeroforma arctica JP610]|uniref:Uncharacterized protein n=1 Tax=Sphaeroforma arctica JP610 TaxID=667725 RepID=A0A0L0FV22_9EUKA|nr:hypothetical protein SARC_06944 [Sphaeroforma arctica JP610]KNC80695.1 hypothetical protein SARC_06944 [Sphaeroforma arctica JP610]|eukprot:XP_014154597.1 hypothetical protein SARC_06944 [Sphaeroforma arctica JP610]
MPIITDFRTTDRIFGPGFYMYKMWEKVVAPMGLHLVMHVNYSPVIVQMRQLEYRIQIITGCWGWRTVDCLDVVHRHSFTDMGKKIVDNLNIPMNCKVFGIFQIIESSETYHLPSRAHAEIMTHRCNPVKSTIEMINGDAVAGINTTNNRAFVVITATVKSLTRYTMLKQLQFLVL